jgi:hypothetical protein
MGDNLKARLAGPRRQDWVGDAEDLRSASPRRDHAPCVKDIPPGPHSGTKCSRKSAGRAGVADATGESGTPGGAVMQKRAS